MSLADAVASADVVFFDKPGCPYCVQAKTALHGEQIDYKLLQIAEYRAALKEQTGKTSAPSVWIKGTYVGGCNDGTLPWHGVRPMLANGLFRKMLTESTSQPTAAAFSEETPAPAQKIGVQTMLPSWWPAAAAAAAGLYYLARRPSQ